MKIIIILFLKIFLNIITLSQVYSSMSYNIRLDTETDSINKWDYRKEALINQLNSYKPDFLGIQEGLHHQVLYIDSSLNYYDYIGVGREDGLTKGEYSAIFFNKEKFSSLTDSTIWLSDQPNNVSIGWDAAMERICTFGLFKENKSGKRAWVFNTHYDHIGKIARMNSSNLIVEIITDLNKEDFPVILMGDFNSTPESKPIEIIKNNLNDAYLISASDPLGPIGTFTGFRENARLEDRIDYIFVKNLIVRSIFHINYRRKDNNFISDHLPVFVKVEFFN